MARKANFAESEGEILRAIIRQKGLTQRKLAQLVGIGEDTINTWVRGIARMKPEDKGKLAVALDIQPSVLNHETEKFSTIDAQVPTPNRRMSEGFALRVAIRHWRGALAGDIYEECTFEDAGNLEVPTYFLVGGYENAERHDVITAAGLSMSPRIQSGERVIIFRDPTPRDHTIVLVESPDYRVYLKVLREINGRFTLCSINEDYPPIDMAGFKIHGYAVAILKNAVPGVPNIEWAEGMALRA